ncbi:uncharacterized protein BJ171DRAFT_499516 [Polychytrium aggregatum]|uniref:uncharacterized protein n=1 Tax=Polychytrium aggregatum TaxID=110093 RepID=UPI0022FF025C|nr:uncharacterized protein BJ171DRAFT_499516 [Polychytrium aggregatum]KAI9205741.1 hypothetical protein BJ171DRAFT_499516 [Polychytrium aggregatum]
MSTPRVIRTYGRKSQPRPYPTLSPGWEQVYRSHLQEAARSPPSPSNATKTIASREEGERPDPPAIRARSVRPKVAEPQSRPFRPAKAQPDPCCPTDAPEEQIPSIASNETSAPVATPSSATALSPSEPSSTRPDDAPHGALVLSDASVLHVAHTTIDSTDTLAFAPTDSPSSIYMIPPDPLDRQSSSQGAFTSSPAGSPLVPAAAPVAPATPLPLRRSPRFLKSANIEPATCIESTEGTSSVHTAIDHDATGSTTSDEPEPGPEPEPDPQPQQANYIVITHVGQRLKRVVSLPLAGQTNCTADLADVDMAQADGVQAANETSLQLARSSSESSFAGSSTRRIPIDLISLPSVSVHSESTESDENILSDLRILPPFACALRDATSFGSFWTEESMDIVSQDPRDAGSDSDSDSDISPAPWDSPSMSARPLSELIGRNKLGWDRAAVHSFLKPPRIKAVRKPRHWEKLSISGGNSIQRLPSTPILAAASKSAPSPPTQITTATPASALGTRAKPAHVRRRTSSSYLGFSDFGRPIQRTFKTNRL